MAYESVLWTAKTPITYDRLAQMQQNIDTLRSLVEGTQTYVTGATKGFGKGILHLQEITTTYTLPEGGQTQIGSGFRPITEAGRRYVMECYFPRVHSYSGFGFVRLIKNNAIFHTGLYATGTDVSFSNYIGKQPGFFPGTVYAAKHIIPGASTTDTYSVALVPIFGNGGEAFHNYDVVGFIKFTDVGPAI